MKTWIIVSFLVHIIHGYKPYVPENKCRFSSECSKIMEDLNIFIADAFWVCLFGKCVADSGGFGPLGQPIERECFTYRDCPCW